MTVVNTRVQCPGECGQQVSITSQVLDNRGARIQPIIQSHTKRDGNPCTASGQSYGPVEVRELQTHDSVLQKTA